MQTIDALVTFETMSEKYISFPSTLRTDIAITRSFCNTITLEGLKGYHQSTPFELGIYHIIINYSFKHKLHEPRKLTPQLESRNIC
jgi:hypothetical protein